jgi:hypothetical protein
MSNPPIEMKKREDSNNLSQSEITFFKACICGGKHGAHLHRSVLYICSCPCRYLWISSVHGDQGPIFRTFFSGEFCAKNFPPKMSGKINIFLGKSFEKLFPQQITQNFLRKITSRRKNVRKIGPRWVCEKNHPKFSPSDFFVKLNTYLLQCKK